MQPVELLSILYELSLTNLKHLDPAEMAGSFVKKFISRKSLHAGSVWSLEEGDDGERLPLQKIYATPEAANEASVDREWFEGKLSEDGMVLSDQSCISCRHMPGKYVYFKLTDFGLLELFYAGSTSISFTKESFLPFQDVVQQFAISLESGFFNQMLQEEVMQRYEAEQSLKNSEEKYRRIIDNIKLGLMEVDTNDVIQFANKPFLKLTGYTLDELVGKNAADLFLADEESRKKIARQNSSRQKGNSSSYEVKLKSKEGNYKWAIISGAPNYDKNGNVIGSIGIHLDITDEKRLKQENEFKTSQLNKLYEMSLDGLVSINAKGEIFEWSKQAEEIFGFSKNEILGRRLQDTIIPNEHRQAHADGMKAYMATGHGPVLNNRIEIVGQRKDGVVIPIELTVFPLEHHNEKYFSAYIRDITEIKESKELMERALQRQKELNNMKSQFISMTSHELRTPLTTIRSNTELLNYQLENVEVLKRDKLLKNVSRIENNVDRLNQLINNILMIGKLDSDKVPFDPRAMDVCEFLGRHILPDFESRNQDIECAKEGEVRSVELDEKLFSHVMTNLLENAIKYSPDGGPPEMKLMFGDDGLCIEVTDHGIGIPEVDQARLFDTFYRASNVDNIQGTGLGLAIVKQFVELHSGTINVRSEVGKGSTFILNFPYIQKNH